MPELINIAIVGATGAVGEAIIEQLAGMELTEGDIYPVASSASVGETVMIARRPVLVRDLAEFDFASVRLALFAVPSAVAAQYVPLAVEAGSVVVDCSSAFRGDDAIPLVIASLNSEDLSTVGARNIVACPHSLAAELALILKPLNDEVEVTAVSVTALMSASDAGRAGVKELATQSAGLLGGKSAEAEVFAQQLAFNVLPQIGAIGTDGYTSVEAETAQQLRRLLATDSLGIDVTCVQVPVFYGNSMVVNIATRYPFDVEDLEQILARIDEISLFDGVASEGLPSPVVDLQSFDKTCVGRIRQSHSRQNGLNLWITSDNVRKSAAKNVLAIAELLLKSYL